MFRQIVGRPLISTRLTVIIFTEGERGGQSSVGPPVFSSSSFSGLSGRRELVYLELGRETKQQQCDATLKQPIHWRDCVRLNKLFPYSTDGNMIAVCLYYLCEIYADKERERERGCGYLSKQIRLCIEFDLFGLMLCKYLLI